MGVPPLVSLPKEERFLVQYFGVSQIERSAKQIGSWKRNDRRTFKVETFQLIDLPNGKNTPGWRRTFEKSSKDN